MPVGRILFTPRVQQAYARMIRTLKEAMPGDLLTQREMRTALRASLRDNYHLYPEEAVVQKQLTAHFEVFRKGAMAPFRSPSRSRSETDDRIIHHRLTTMAREDKVSRCRETELIMICPVVIVDKNGANSLRCYPDSKIDERSVNSLSLSHDCAGSFVLLPSKNAHDLNSVAAFDTKSYRQSEELNATIHMLRYNIVQSEIVPSGSPGEARMRVTLTQDHIVHGKPIELKAPWEAAESTKIKADEFESAVGKAQS
ncbi:hypothetical protein FOL46_006198 [Perkinsus olseni]|uniref:Uncharacterized protein n=1 Tax=Perkinsus olseni TaxID=32597 RepID=A0A7J6LM09_PEROL|nr:hypothetical protein FOL46_006198 [Perkinsus olseni]